MRWALTHDDGGDEDDDDHRHHHHPPHRHHHRGLSVSMLIQVQTDSDTAVPIRIMRMPACTHIL